MKTIRIFISSPGDVAEERDKARQVVHDLQRRYLGRLDLVPVLWEDLALQADTSFQQGIELVLSREHGVDIAVFILWSRLGSPLGKRVRKPDGNEYRSGTEREFDLMLQARQQSGGQRPAILAYVRQDDKGFNNALKDKPTNELEAIIQQRKAAEAFIREQFHEAEGGHNARAYHTFTEPVSFAVRLRTHLAQLLDEMLPELALGASQARWQGSPFRGLQAFEFEHADIFFGRDQAVADVQLRLGEQASHGCAFVLIVGASGGGKSSLARAGVLPALANQHLDETVKVWRRAVLVPGQHAGDLCLGLARVLLEALPELREDESSLRKLADALRKDSQLAYDLRIEGVLKRLGGRLVLLVDQLEEVFTHSAIQPEDLSRLFTALDALARSGKVWVLATVRSDFYARCQAWPVLMAMKEPRGQHDLLLPTSAELRRIITEPVWLAGLRYERNESGETLDQRVLDGAVKHPEALPLLEYLLSELYERRTPEGLLTWKAYTDLGGVEGALGQRAEHLFRELSVDAQNALGVVLHGLVTVSEEDENAVVRQRALLEALTDTPGKTALVQALLQARLLVADKSETGQAVVHVAHEALLRRWERVVRWAEENREFLRVRARVAARMKEGSRLLDGDPLLEAARHQLAAAPAGFNPEQTSFIEECLRAAQQGRLRRERLRQYVIAGLSVLLLMAVGMAGWAMIKQREASSARDRAVSAETNAVAQRMEAVRLQNEQIRITKETRLREAMITWRAKAQKATADRQFPENVLYAARALGFRGYGYESLTAEQQHTIAEKFPALFDPKEHPDLYQDLRQPMDGAVKPLLPIWSSPVANHHGDVVKCVAFSLDGKTLASGSGDKTIKLWDVATGQERATLRGHSNWVSSVAFSRDGKTLASGSWDNTIKLWDVATGQERATLRGHSEPVNSVGFSPDGKTLASGSWDNTIKLWEVATGQERASLRGHSESVYSVAFSPDGKTLASGSFDSTIKLWDGAAPALDLSAYLSGKWYEFAEATGDVHPASAVLDNLYKEHTYGFINVGRGTHVGVLQSAGSPQEANRLLFEHYCRNQAWDGAFALLDQPMDQPVAPGLHLWLARELLVSGQYVKAAAIYQKHQGTTFPDGRKWNTEVLNDFKLFREQGHTHPDMEKIEALLK